LRVMTRAVHFKSFVVTEVTREAGFIMRTIHIRALAIGVFALFTFAGAAAAQSDAGKNPELLTPKQVRELVANAKTPADHLKLSRHFFALADKYEADATEHRELAAVYRKAPTASETKRPGVPDTAAHCDRFAELAADAAKVGRSLATAHVGMAAKH
jgi:hypothetical protein